MKAKVLHTEAEHEKALARIDQIFDAKPGTAEGDELDLLVLLVEHYESNHFEIPAPDPISAIRFRMGQQGLKAKDMAPFFGSTRNATETLSGRKSLTLTVIRKLVEGLGIPAESLLRTVAKPKRLAK